MQLDDEVLIALLARCALRDAKALDLLYGHTSAYLNAVSWRIVRNAETCNDVLQEAYVQIWQNADGYRPHLSRPMTWMTSIVRYRALDRLQYDKKHLSALHQDQDELLDQLVGDESVDAGTVCSGFSEDIQYCLANLDCKMRRCVELAYLYGFSREELAETMDTKVNTIKSWLHRGAQKLKVCLESQNDH